MKRRLRLLPVILLCTALFTGYGAKAQASKARAEEGAVPAQFKGNWALPDCRAYDEALIVTRRFYLKSDKDGSQLWPIASLGKKKDYWVLSVEGQERPVRLEADGILKIGILPDKAAPAWPQGWDALMLDSKREYMGCADLPAVLPDPLVRAMLRIDAVADDCGKDFSGACARLLFDVADNNKNGKISTNEMKMAGAMLAGLEALVGTHAAGKDTLNEAFYNGLIEGEKIAALLMPNDEELGYAEMARFMSETDSPPLQKALAAVGALFPAFTEAARRTPAADGH